MSGADRIVVERELPRIAEVTAQAPGRVIVAWSEGRRAGRREAIDLGPMLYTLKLYTPLRDDLDLFGTVHVAAFGTAIAWGDADPIDMSAAALEELAESAMTNADFRSFLDRHRLTLDGAAAQLGISRRLVAYYAKDRDIPRYIALACGRIDQMSRRRAA